MNRMQNIIGAAGGSVPRSVRYPTAISPLIAFNNASGFGERDSSSTVNPDEVSCALVAGPIDPNWIDVLKADFE